jgi:polyhydroxyalkanoate synthesis regulator phasin
MAKRKNTFTRFIEDMVDDTKDLVDDLLDRAKDLETDAKDAVKDVVDDDEKKNSTSSLADLESAIASLTAHVNQLASIQAAASAPARRSSSTSAAA